MADTTETMLDLEGARQWLDAHGMHYEVPQMKRMMANKKLPFRTGPCGRRKFVPVSALEKFLQPGELANG